MTTQLTYKGRECRILGTVGASRPCDCCGNSVLEKAVAILVDDCDVYEIGSVCASKAIFGNARNAAKVKRLAAEADSAAKAALRSSVRQAAFRMVHKMETDPKRFGGSAAAEALCRYSSGRKIDARRPWFCGDWAVAVDTSDAADMKCWAAMGFAPKH
jgi:hypothetical protein